MLNATPAQLYLAQLSKGSQGMRQCLDTIAAILDPEHDANSFLWEQVTYREAVTVRMELVARYRPSTVNKMLSALRGALKQTWRLGLIDSDTYHRAIAVENVKCKRLLSGRALEYSEITQLFDSCNDGVRGVRDAAILALFYGCGLRRGELVSLRLSSFDPDDSSIKVGGKRGKQRKVYLPANGRSQLQTWINERGSDAGPLFCPVNQKGVIHIIKMRGESIAYILKRRQRQAGIDHFSAHDLRRTTITHLLDAGVDVLTVQRVAGHADPSTTSKYDQRGEDAKRQASVTLNWLTDRLLYQCT